MELLAQILHPLALASVVSSACLAIALIVESVESFDLKSEVLVIIN